MIIFSSKKNMNDLRFELSKKLRLKNFNTKNIRNLLARKISHVQYKIFNTFETAKNSETHLKNAFFIIVTKWILISDVNCDQNIARFTTRKFDKHFIHFPRANLSEKATVASTKKCQNGACFLLLSIRKDNKKLAVKKPSHYRRYVLTNGGHKIFATPCTFLCIDVCFN